jgi:hypothetical protein
MNRFAGLRTMVDRFLVDTCTITDDVAEEFDPDSGTYPDPGDGAEVYSGRCRVAPAGGDRVVDAGDGPRSLRTFNVTIPWDATGVEINHLVTIGTSADPHLEGRIMRVVDVQGGSDNPHRRLVCEDTLTVTSEGGS